jgi:hypothetical protein
MKKIPLIIFIFIGICSQAQKKYYWKDILLTMTKDTSRLYIGPTDSLIFTNIYPMKGLDSTLLKDNRIVSNREIEIDKPKTKLYKFHEGLFQDLHFNKPVDISLNGVGIQIQNCIFENTLNLSLKDSDEAFFISNSKIIGSFIWAITDYSRVSIYNNEFISDREKSIVNIFDIGISQTNTQYFLDIFDADTLRVHNSKLVGFAQFFATVKVKATNLEIEHNFFNCPDLPQIFLEIDSEVSSINGNRFGTNLIITGNTSKLLKMNENKFEEMVAFNELLLPEKMQIDWISIKDELAITSDTLMIFKEIPVKYHFSAFDFMLPKDAKVYNDSYIGMNFMYRGQTTEALRIKSSFKKLIEIHKTLYDSYRLKGDIESANGCFVAAKDLEGRRLAAIYDQQGGFKNYFSWKLNQLMKFYTNHATEPALALVVSVYILLGFAVFYFFFPSEWDIESKGKLLKHYRDFILKNDKGYLVPFLKMLFGFFLSFLNALTLSLNSFVTLGFGNIPTKGIARYVCIIQGFIGWFLLSIFTVSLFNQVLF